MLERFYRYGAKVLIRTIYRLKSVGTENIPSEGAAILISNHISYMDGLVINAICKRPVRFVIEEDIYNQPFVKHFMELNRAIPIAAKKKSVKWALEQVSDAIKNGDLICIFPEGKMTYTGNMSRFRFGIEWMIKNEPAPVVPIAIQGLWGSIFSRKYRKSNFQFIPEKLFRKVTVACGEIIPPEKAKINLLQREVMNLKNNCT